MILDLAKENIRHTSLFVTVPFSDRVQRKQQLHSVGNWGKPYNYDILHI